jgi:hypothetical protein
LQIGRSGDAQGLLGERGKRNEKKRQHEGSSDSIRHGAPSLPST